MVAIWKSKKLCRNYRIRKIGIFAVFLTVREKFWFFFIFKAKWNLTNFLKMDRWTIWNFLHSRKMSDRLSYTQNILSIGFAKLDVVWQLCGIWCAVACIPCVNSAILPPHKKKIQNPSHYYQCCHLQLLLLCDSENAHESHTIETLLKSGENK